MVNIWQHKLTVHLWCEECQTQIGSLPIMTYEQTGGQLLQSRIRSSLNDHRDKGCPAAKETA